MSLRYLLGLALCLGIAAGAQDQTKADDGKALVNRACAKCHGLASVMRERNSRGRWSDIVDDMIARGAEVSDADFEKVVDYLAKNLGPRINVNKATAEQLAEGLGIPGDTASAIVSYRQKNGSFKTLEELKKVPALNAADIESKKDRLDFSEAK
jgi:competence protein ComEA